MGLVRTDTGVGAGDEGDAVLVKKLPDYLCQGLQALLRGQARVRVGRAAPGSGATDFRALAEALLGAFHSTAPPVPRMRSIVRSIPALGSMRARDYHLPARP